MPSTAPIRHSCACGALTVPENFRTCGELAKGSQLGAAGFLQSVILLGIKSQVS